MTKMWSYFYPITKRVSSGISGTLEITWYNGKKHLNTKNANYSYGSLQQILKFGLGHITLDTVKSVLLLGLGGGSVIETLRKDFHYTNGIVAVDIDPVVIELAKTEFDIYQNENLEIICEDALKFMQSNTKLFDLIIIDVFVDTKVPESILDLPFWHHIVEALPPNGAIIFNASLEKKKSAALNTVIEFLKSQIYTVDVYEKVHETNTVIIAKGL